MILISHRGNTNGIRKDENSPYRIIDVLNNGYHCEIDVWYESNKFWLGHDKPTYSIDLNFLCNSKLWCHAKNIEALDIMTDNNIHCFWHENDKYTLTNKGYIWSYPGVKITNKCVIIDLYKPSIQYDCYGICSDFIEKYSS